jgi:serine/threonine-protein kinase
MVLDRSVGDDPEQQLHRACAELRERLRAGENCRSEDFLNSHPSLSSNPSYALELIQTELDTRRELGETLDPLVWYERFPHWHEPIEAWFRKHGLLSDSLPLEPATVEQTPVTVGRPPSSPPALLGRFGRYNLIEQLPRGGMGVVYKALDTLLDRVVALKMIRRGERAGPGETERFAREARAAAQLHHPHIITLHDFGREEDQYYITMAFAPGGSLAENRPHFTDPREAAVLMEKIARAVHHLHSKGILHRDLKPGNIMLDEHGEPLVSDFGLAKFLDADAELTQEGVIVGTPAYMAPDLVAAQPGGASIRSDVWSLGVIFYELLTGKRPFVGSGVKEVSQNILLITPPRPRSLKAGLDPSLEMIVLTCLEKDPERRYASAEALVADLRHWLQGLPIQSRTQSRFQRTWQWLRRRPRLALGAGIFCLLAVATAVFLKDRKTPSKPPPSREQSLDPALDKLQRDLAAGKTCTLVGKTGVPAYFRWRTEKQRPPLVQGPGPLVLESFALSLFELVPDPQQDSYQLSAQVHLRATNEGEAGLYFLEEERPTPAGPEHGFFALTFADRGFLASRVQLKLVHYCESTPAKGLNRLESLFVDQPLAPRKWHDLRVMVRTGTIVAACDGKPLSRINLVGRKEEIGMRWSQLHRMKANPPPVPALGSRSSLGLFVRRGTASFRNVVITPFQPEKSK